MEGYLRKRCLNLPVMTNRFCVIPINEFTLLSYKSEDIYKRSPEKYLSKHQIKCLGQWTGKGKFHTYPNPFVVETKEGKLFHCSAPTPEEQRQWISAFDTIRKHEKQQSSASSGEYVNGEDEDEDQDTNMNDYGAIVGGTQGEESNSNQSIKDQLSRSICGKDEEGGELSERGKEEGNGERILESYNSEKSIAEPDDWGIYQEDNLQTENKQAMEKNLEMDSSREDQHSFSSPKATGVSNTLLDEDPFSSLPVESNAITVSDYTKEEEDTEIMLGKSEDFKRNIAVSRKEGDKEESSLDRKTLIELSAARMKGMRDEGLAYDEESIHNSESRKSMKNRLQKELEDEELRFKELERSRKQMYFDRIDRFELKGEENFDTSYRNPAMKFRNDSIGHDYAMSEYETTAEKEIWIEEEKEIIRKRRIALQRELALLADEEERLFEKASSHYNGSRRAYEARIGTRNSRRVPNDRGEIERRKSEMAFRKYGNRDTYPIETRNHSIYGEYDENVELYRYESGDHHTPRRKNLQSYDNVSYNEKKSMERERREKPSKNRSRRKDREIDRVEKPRRGKDKESLKEKDSLKKKKKKEKGEKRGKREKKEKKEKKEKRDKTKSNDISAENSLVVYPTANAAPATYGNQIPVHQPVYQQVYPPSYAVQQHQRFMQNSAISQQYADYSNTAVDYGPAPPPAMMSYSSMKSKRPANGFDLPDVQTW